MIAGDVARDARYDRASMSRATSKLPFQGRLFSVQPRIRLTRSYNESTHSYLGYVLGLHGTLGSETAPRDVQVGIGKAAQEKHSFQVGDDVKGEAEPVPFPPAEPCEVFDASKLEVVERSANAIHKPPPWHGPAPALTVYRARGHRRLSAKTYETKCSSCMWGCRMAVEVIKDNWRPHVGVKWRYETFCYGPKDCAVYVAGPQRKAPGRRGMVYVEPDWVDEENTRHRGPSE